VFAKEGYPFILTALVIFVVIFILPKSLLTLLALAVLALFLWFFRDPERDIPPFDEIAVSAADGKVIDIQEDVEFEGRTYNKLSVFMNVFNVHVNRMPLTGTITNIRHKPGSFIPADRPEAGDRNEQNIIHVDTAYGSMVVKQIAGLVARRTVCYWDKGDKVCFGDRLGIIKFSSRVDLYLPKSFDIIVKNGDIVKAGETVIAKLNDR
jgi:phosphatidylserine decarboxylase